ncbi:hypothetical protein PCANC_28553 [Puccinia coronata f. sp. avenae]|uniref:Reverse transcriptase/retrotransposon-derived protein RNase H-like domain-containing protein n=1 Tax=Puccinia coronata f. sp. avenae TaxID=200324 RepID=A0A2N5TJW6_9BASI|nr:hypothetical protein PCANC_28553 [Puccinia coronata f. sp. avenae]
MFIPGLSELALPLRKLTYKDADWEWSQKCQEAFEKLKKIVGYDVTLKKLDYNEGAGEIKILKKLQIYLWGQHFKLSLPALTGEHGCSSGAQTAVFDRWSDGHCPTEARANWSDRFVRPVPAGPVQPVPGTDRTGLSDPPAGALVRQCLSDHRSNTAVRAPLELPCSTG